MKKKYFVLHEYCFEEEENVFFITTVFFYLPKLFMEKKVHAPWPSTVSKDMF